MIEEGKYYLSKRVGSIAKVLEINRQTDEVVYKIINHQTPMFIGNKEVTDINSFWRNTKKEIDIYRIHKNKLKI